MARRSKQCACVHLVETDPRTPVPGSGSLSDPHVHELPRIVRFKYPDSYEEGELVIDENGCVILPDRVRRLLVEDEIGSLSLPDDDGIIDIDEYISSFDITAWDHPDPNFSSVTATFNPGVERHYWTISGFRGDVAAGAPAASVAPIEGDGFLFTNYQDVIFTPGDTAFDYREFAYPQLSVEQYQGDDYTFDIQDWTQFAPNFGGVEVKLWDAFANPLNIDRRTNVITEIRFCIFYGSPTVLFFPNGQDGPLYFRIVERSGNVLHRGMWSPGAPTYKQFGYSSVRQFPGNSTLLGAFNSDEDILLQIDTARPDTTLATSETLQIRDIITTRRYL